MRPLNLPIGLSILRREDWGMPLRRSGLYRRDGAWRVAGTRRSRLRLPQEPFGWERLNACARHTGGRFADSRAVPLKSIAGHRLKGGGQRPCL